MICRYDNNDVSSSKDFTKYQGELKNPFENKNKHIRIKGPTPNTKRTIFAFLGDCFCSSFSSITAEVDFFFNFLLGISQIELKDNDSSNKSRNRLYQYKNMLSKASNDD